MYLRGTGAEAHCFASQRGPEGPLFHGFRTKNTKAPDFCRRLKRKPETVGLSPRYMNVPCPAPSHICVDGVGKLSVWSLRIIVESQFSLCHQFGNLSNREKWRGKSGAGCRNRTCFVSLKRRVHIHICQSRKNLVVRERVELSSRGYQPRALIR